MNVQVMDTSAPKSSCLLVTTGGSTVDRHQTVAEANAARQSRLGVVVLGVGSLVNGSEAAAIATHDDAGVVFADSFDHLLSTNVDFVDLLADTICGMHRVSSPSREACVYITSTVNILYRVNAT